MNSIYMMKTLLIECCCEKIAIKTTTIMFENWILAALEIEFPGLVWSGSTDLTSVGMVVVSSVTRHKGNPVYLGKNLMLT